MKKKKKVIIYLTEACDAERGEYGMYGCEKFLSGRSGYIHFGGEGEFAEFAINIDQHDPCYGYYYYLLFYYLIILCSNIHFHKIYICLCE